MGTGFRRLDAVETVHRRFVEVARRLRRRTAPGGLTPLQVLVLRVLAAHPDSVRPSDLAERLAVTPGTVTPLVDRLIRAGLVTRERDPEDRRVLRLSLTPEGRACLRRADEEDRRLWTVALSGLDAGQLKVLSDLLERIVQALDQADAETRP